MDAEKTESRISGILVVVLIVMATGVCPVLASGSTIPGSAGSLQSPALGIWEQDVSPSLEDGDAQHSLDGSQFLPPCISGEEKSILIFTVMTAGEGTGPASVSAVVDNAQGSFQNPITMSPLTKTEGIFATENAGAANLISYTGAASPDEVISRLHAGTASVWKGTLEIPYGAIAGDYVVTVTGVDQNNNPCSPSANAFTYIPQACMEYDFTTVHYGSIGINKATWVQGDDMFGTGDKPSVRNVGNCPARLKVVQDDMGTGKNTGGGWNIQYGVRLGDTSDVNSYNPEHEVVLADQVMPGTVEPLDFSVEVFEGSGDHAGTMALGFEQVGIADLDYSLIKEAQTEDEDTMPIPEFPKFSDILDLVVGFVDMVM